MIVKELFARLGIKVDDASVAKGERAFDKVKSAAIAVAGILAAGAVAKGFANMAFAAATAGDEIAKTSKQIGVNAQALQELQFAAGLAGASASDLTTGLRLLQKNALEASQGTASFVEDFDALGVTVTDSTGKLKTAEVLFAEVSEGIRGLESATERTALAQTLLGRSGTKLIPLLTQGADAIAAQRKEAQELGGVFSDELLGQSEELIDAQLRYQTAVRGVRNVLASVLIPTLTKVVNGMAKIVAGIGRFIKGTQIFQVVLVGFGLVASSIALILVAKLVAALASVATVAISATAGLSGLGTAALIAQAKVLLLGTAFILLIGLLVLIADEIAVALKGGDTLGRRLGDTLSDLIDQFLEFKTDNPFIIFLQDTVRLLTAAKNLAFGLVMLVATGEKTGLALGLKEVAEATGVQLDREVGTTGLITTTEGFLESERTITRNLSATGGSTRSVNVGEVIINAAPNQSATEVGIETRRQLESMLDDRDAADEQILVPAQAGTAG